MIEQPIAGIDDLEDVSPHCRVIDRPLLGWVWRYADGYGGATIRWDYDAPTDPPHELAGNGCWVQMVELQP